MLIKLRSSDYRQVAVGVHALTKVAKEYGEVVSLVPLPTRKAKDEVGGVTYVYTSLLRVAGMSEVGMVSLHSLALPTGLEVNIVC